MYITLAARTRRHGVVVMIRAEIKEIYEVTINGAKINMFTSDKLNTCTHTLTIICTWMHRFRITEVAWMKISRRHYFA